ANRPAPCKRRAGITKPWRDSLALRDQGVSPEPESSPEESPDESPVPVPSMMFGEYVAIFVPLSSFTPPLIWKVTTPLLSRSPRAWQVKESPGSPPASYDSYSYWKYCGSFIENFR